MLTCCGGAVDAGGDCDELHPTINSSKITDVIANSILMLITIPPSVLKLDCMFLIRGTILFPCLYI